MFMDIDISMRVFIKKTSYEMCINRGITTTTQGVHESLVIILSFLIFFSLVKSFEEEI